MQQLGLSQCMTQQAVIVPADIERIRKERKEQIMLLLDNYYARGVSVIAKQLGLYIANRNRYVRELCNELVAEGRAIYEPFCGYRSKEL